MGVDFTIRYKSKGLLGGLKSKNGPLKVLGDWFEENLIPHLTKATLNGSKLVIVPFPEGDAIEIEAKGGAFEFRGRTSALGPGWHIHIVDRIKEAAQAAGLVAAGGSNDDTGYFETGDKQAVRDAMHNWLSGVATVMGEHAGMEGLRICMPTHVAYDMQAGEAVATPTGPRDATWIQRTAKDGAMGIDFWPIYGDREAEVHRGVALWMMWNVLPWRPLASEEEAIAYAGTMGQIVACWQAEPALDMPWREIEQLLEDEPRGLPEGFAEDVPRRAAACSGPLVGWRRRTVVRTFGGWSVEMPGGLGEEGDGNSVTFFDHERSLRMTFMSYKPQPGMDNSSLMESMKQKAPPESVARHDRERGGIRMVGHELLENDEDGKRRTLFSVNMVPGEIVMLTYSWPEGSDDRWARSSWDSLKWEKREPPVVRRVEM